MSLHTDPNPVLSGRDFSRVAAVVHRHCGIVLSDGKRELVQVRLAKRLRATGHTRFTDYLDDVLAEPRCREFVHLIDALCTNLTQFLREPQHFERLRTSLLPRLIAERSHSARPCLRGWSAGCSTGEEAYSIVLTLLAALPDAARWDVKLLATDLSTRVLARAATGTYPAATVRGHLPAKWVDAYFHPRRFADGTDALAVVPAVRDRVAFRHLNLADDRWPVRGPFDFIFCRNVMIYFDKPTQARLVERFARCLRPGGWLLTGHSESLAGVPHDLKFVAATVYQR